MGWNTNIVLINKPYRAPLEGLYKALGIAVEPAGQATVEEVFSDCEHAACVWQGNTLFFGADLACDLTADDSRYLSRLHAVFPAQRIVAGVLASVVNGCTFAVYDDGQRIRHFVGSSVTGLVADDGDPLPEERRVLARCPVEEHPDGTTVCVGPDGDRRPYEEMGEEFLFELMASFLGWRPDGAEAGPFFEYGVEVFRRQRGIWPFLMRLVGR